MISKKYNEILKKLEKGITGEKNLNLVKAEIIELSLAYIEEITKITDNYNEKLIELEKRLSKLENNFNTDELEDELEDDLVDETEPEIHLSETITCPYCGYDFSVEYDESNHEITCPECNNLIELDWGEFEDDM